MSRSVSERSRRGSRGKAAAKASGQDAASQATVVERPPSVSTGTAAPSHDAAAAHAASTRTAERIPWGDRTVTIDGIYERLRALRGILEGIGLLEVLAMALAVRGIWVLSAGFPLNDGGLFYVFAEDIQRAGYRLPEFSSYNDGTIPFAYPPLGFYVTALLDDLTPLSLLDVVWLLPMIESVAVVGAFYLLSKSLLRDRWTVVLAAVAFTLAPRSFIWLIMGGGLTRALALALTLTAIHQARRACIEGDRTAGVRAAVLLGLTLLTTLETAAWALASLPLFTLFPWATHEVQRRRLLMLGAIGLGAFAITLPWLTLVIARHGLDPFLAAREFGGSAIGQMDVEMMWRSLTNPVHTGEPFFPVIAGLGLIGAIYAAVRGQWLLPAWWVATVVMGTRAFPTLATIPIAMLAAVAARDVLGPALLRTGTAIGSERRKRRLAVAAVGGVALLFLVGASLEDDFGDQRYLRALTDADVQAMEWIAQETPPDARFLVLSRNGWYADRDGEWFPALAERENVATVQGYEWVSGEFTRRQELQTMAQMCLPGEGNCLGQLSNLEDFDYVYVPETCCDALRELIDNEWRYVAIFDNGATVFQRVTGPVRPNEVDLAPRGKQLYGGN